MFNYDWTLKEANFTKDKGKVFSCFACGGGSTMGYKLAGFDVIGINEIDPKMAEIYKTNHNPKHAFIEPIQDFVCRDEYPKELYNLDILDGSPPCSSFSFAGARERDWGKKKKFREGQAEQVLDSLFFDFIELAWKLQPKVVIAENVKGLLLGNAKEYVKRIYEDFDKAGYYCQHWLLDSQYMGVPQRRERVFFICIRKDLATPFLTQMNLFDVLPKLDLEFKDKPILYKEIVDENDKTEAPTTAETYKLYNAVKRGRFLREAHPKGYFFQERRLSWDMVCSTIIAGSSGDFHPDIYRRLNKSELLKASSFPKDYNFLKTGHKYVMGMSVPPIMVARIVTEVYNQWLSKIN
tara:strand:+ start:7804 stop:8856 length:1053 start_codon:yes stop_codon:yes gene_type:complete